MTTDSVEKLFDVRKLQQLQVGLRGSSDYEQMRDAAVATITIPEGTDERSKATANLMDKDAFIRITPELFPSYVIDNGAVTSLSAHLPYAIENFKQAQRAVRKQEARMVGEISKADLTGQIIKDIQGGTQTRERIAVRLTDGDPQLSLLDTWWRTADNCVEIHGTSGALKRFQESVNRRNTMIDQTIARVEGSGFPVTGILTGSEIIMAGKKEGAVKKILGKIGLGNLTEYDNWGFYYPKETDSTNLSGGYAWLTLVNFALATCQANGFPDQQLEPEYISEAQLKQLTKEGKRPRTLHKPAKQALYESGDIVTEARNAYIQRMWGGMREYLAEVLTSQGADPAAFPIGDLAVIDNNGESVGLKNKLEGLLRTAEGDIQRGNIERALRAVQVWDAYVARTSGEKAIYQVNAPSTETALAITTNADQAIQDPAVGANIMSMTGDLLNTQNVEVLTAGLELHLEDDDRLTPADVASRLTDQTVSTADRMTLFTRMMTNVSGVRWLFEPSEFEQMSSGDPRIALQINELQLLIAYTRPSRLRMNEMFNDDDFVSAALQARVGIKQMVQFLRIHVNPEIASLPLAPEEETPDIDVSE